MSRQCSLLKTARMEWRGARRESRGSRTDACRSPHAGRSNSPFSISGDQRINRFRARESGFGRLLLRASEREAGVLASHNVQQNVSFTGSDARTVQDEQCQKIGGGYEAAKVRFLLFL